MRLFPPAARPRVFAVAPGEDFAAALVAGLRDRLAEHPPEALARVALTVNTNRARRAVVAAFEAGTDACWLPRVGTLDELADDPATDAPPAVEPRRRALRLTRLVAAFLDNAPEHGPRAAAPALAAALSALLDETQREGADLARLDAAAPPEHAAHWDVTLRFMAILREAWPAILAEAEGGAVDPEARRRVAAEALAAAWAAEPPAGPVIAAGSTGSRATTALYLAVVARLPQGAVVLPGFAPGLAAEDWAEIGEEHPWAGFRRLLDRLGLAPGDVAWWTPPDRALDPRRRLMAQTFRPAPVTDRWRAALPALRAEAAAAMAGLTLVEAPDARREAVAVAVAMRGALAEGRTAALVTPDRTLARRVAAALRRWGIEADDSSGRPLGLTPPGVFLRLVADVAFRPFDPVALIALLKHPLLAAGEGRGVHVRAARRFEVNGLRRRIDVASLADAARVAPEARAAELVPALERLAALGATAPELSALAAAHVAAAEALAGPELWRGPAGEAAERSARAFVAATEVYGPCAPAEYPPLFSAALTGDAREAAFRPDPRAAIRGPLDARMARADLVILGGLVEGVWPAPPPPDPWLSRPMRAAIGLPSPERLVGLRAHDVMTAACGPRVVLSCRLREGGAPANRSRWLERLVTLTGGVGEGALAAMRARGADLLALVAPLERLAGTVPPAERPRPRPAVKLRPRQLSATEVETLIRDPFAIYARRVLGLRPLDPVGRPLDARDRGRALHRALERLARGGPDAEAALAEAALALDGEAATPALRRLWRARLERARARLVAGETARRAMRQGASLVEEKGVRASAAPAFTLTARADRLDPLPDGRVAIYDYKTGSAPSDKQIEAFAKQLPLEGAIAMAGGFAPLGPARPALLAHIVLGGAEAGSAQPLEADAEAAAEEAWAGLLRLIAAYDDPAAGYPARARPRFLRENGDYDHLSRFGEWEDGS